MARADRAKLIQDIESARNSKLLVYVTGDRRGFEAQIAFDVLSLLHDHLERIGKAGDLDVFLYSTGGLTIAGWRIAGLLREFCEGKLSFLIPYKAQSTATLMVLGADEIMMGPMGQLSPIDPSLTSPYSPRDPASGQPLPISVEDVAGYFEMARDMAKLSGSTELQAVFSKLTDAVSPLALGGVFRVRQQIRDLAAKLLSRAGEGKLYSEREIEAIVENLVVRLGSHDYLITRKEARDGLGLATVREPDANLADLMWRLYKEYERDLELLEPFSPEAVLGTAPMATVEVKQAVVESAELCHVFATTHEFKVNPPMTIPGPPGQPPTLVPRSIQGRLIRQGWGEAN